MGISVVINTYNEEKNLQSCLDSLKGFDEILVCDMESTDATVEIARRNGCRVVTFPRGEHRCAEPARDFADHQAENEWLLVIDADETITPELHDYLYDFIRDPEDIAGLYIPRKNYLLGRFKQSSYPDAQLRFFRKEGSYWPPQVHTFPQVAGPTRHIPASRKDLALRHKSFTMHALIERMNRYTTIEVDKRLGKKKGSLWRMIVEPWIFFLKVYVLHGSWRYGTAGYIAAKKDAAARFYLLAKLYERQEEIKAANNPGDTREKKI